MSFTLGPWTVSGLSPNYVVRLIDQPSGVPQSQTVAVVSERIGATEANAALIAAAPDLLEALTEMLAGIDQHALGPDDVARARAALARAKGEQVEA